MGMTIGKDQQFANPSEAEEPQIVIPPEKTNSNSTHMTTKLHPDFKEDIDSDLKTPVLNFVIEDEEELSEDRFFGKGTRRSQEISSIEGRSPRS